MPEPFGLAMAVAFMVLFRFVVARTFLRRSAEELRNYDPTRFEVVSWYLAASFLLIGAISWFLPTVIPLRTIRVVAPLVMMVHLLGTFLMDSIRDRPIRGAPST